jgi:ATP-dependent Clp protease adapter protein ClpS
MTALCRFLCLLLVGLHLGDAFTLRPSSHTPVRTALSMAQQQPQQLRRRQQQQPLSVRAAATIEREDVKIGGPAVLDRPQERRLDEPTKEGKGLGHEAWEVRIYNDGLNTREHVARSLVQVTGMSEVGAYQTMMMAHKNGMAVVGRWVYEVAEMYHEALRENGIVCDIVPVEEE